MILTASLFRHILPMFLAQLCRPQTKTVIDWSHEITFFEHAISVELSSWVGINDVGGYVLEPFSCLAKFGVHAWEPLISRYTYHTNIFFYIYVYDSISSMAYPVVQLGGNPTSEDRRYRNGLTAEQNWTAELFPSIPLLRIGF